MKGIYLAAYKANHPTHDITYQDINGQRDIDGDMLQIDIKQKPDNTQNTPQAKRQGGTNVHNVIEQFLKDINA